MIVPTLRVGMPPGTLCVPTIDTRPESCARVTRSVTGCITTRSVGTIRSHHDAQALKNQAGPQAASLCFCGTRPVERPSAGSAQWATRHGCRVSRPRPWMADGGGPTEQDRSEGMPSPGEVPNVRGKSPWLLGAFPSDPPSGRNPKPPLPQKRICPQPQSHPQNITLLRRGFASGSGLQRTLFVAV